MKQRCKNIYQNARRFAGFTQEQASELLFISTRSLAEYEAGRTVPPDDTVCRMIEVYKTEWLGYAYLKQSSEVGRKLLPEIEFTDLPRSVLKLQKEVYDINQFGPEMITMACSGTVSEIITKAVMEMVGAGLGVIFHQKEKRALV
jgi:transcriptional regulator with XRE-family HTH domain